MMMSTEANNQTEKDESSSTFVSPVVSTITDVEEKTSTVSEFDDMTTNKEENYFTTASTNKNEEEIPTSTSHSRLFNILANISQHMTTQNPPSESTFHEFNSTIIENHTSK